MPGKVVAAGNGANTTAVFAGTDPRTGSGYVYLETLGGGMGARPTGDGKDGVQVGITNTSNLPVEAIEMEYPLRVEEYALVEDSGGAGKYRGGMGLRRVVSPVGHDCLFNGAGERFSNRPWGLEGGRPGGSGRFVLQGGATAPRRLDDKPSGVMVTPEQQIVVETPGAGGWGEPSGRDPEVLAGDRASGKFSHEYLRENYGDELMGDIPDD
jgi:N-methylhydantoinase B